MSWTSFVTLGMLNGVSQCLWERFGRLDDVDVGHSKPRLPIRRTDTPHLSLYPPLSVSPPSGSIVKSLYESLSKPASTAKPRVFHSPGMLPSPQCTDGSSTFYPDPLWMIWAGWGGRDRGNESPSTCGVRLSPVAVIESHWDSLGVMRSHGESSP